MISKALIEQQRERIKALEILQDAAKSKDGQVILTRLREITGFDQSGYRPTPHDTAYVAGLRDAFVLLNAEISVDVGEMIKNLNERNMKNG